jgi:hypothetical protein
MLNIKMSKWNCRNEIVDMNQYYTNTNLTYTDLTILTYTDLTILTYTNLY